MVDLLDKEDEDTALWFYKLPSPWMALGSSSHHVLTPPHKDPQESDSRTASESCRHQGIRVV